MAGPKTKTKPETKPKLRAMQQQDVAMLESLGYSGDLPDELVRTFWEFKLLSDEVAARRLSNEGWATVVMLYRLRTEI